MKTLQHTLKLAMIACILVFASCSKDDSPSEDSTAIEEPTTLELLKSGKWYIQSTSGSGSNNACERQSYLNFIDEDSIIHESYYEDAGMNCLSDGIQLLSYQMTGENQFLLAESPSHPFDIVLISETDLIINQTNGVDNFTITMKK